MLYSHQYLTDVSFKTSHVLQEPQVYKSQIHPLNWAQGSSVSQKASDVDNSCWKTHKLCIYFDRIHRYWVTTFSKYHFWGLGCDRGNQDYKLHPKFCRQSVALPEQPGKGTQLMCKHVWGPGFKPMCPLHHSSIHKQEQHNGKDTFQSTFS